MKLKTLITIGHGAYRGTNSLRHCTSKKRAVEELRYRGVSKEKAIDAINLVLETPYGNCTITTENQLSVIEIENTLQRAKDNHWNVLNYKNRGVIEQEYSL
jgi:hypothetical protein